MKIITLILLINMIVLTACGGGSIGTPASVHSVSLTWTEEVAGVITYTVYRGTAPGGPYTKLTTTTDRAYVDDHIKEGTYYYVVDAEIGGQSYRSNELKATP